jgi:hypothetical protein
MMRRQQSNDIPAEARAGTFQVRADQVNPPFHVNRLIAASILPDKHQAV